METFECSMCGRCCMILLARKTLIFPYSHNNGICEEFIPENNYCSVYKDRPTICNLEKLITAITQKSGLDISLVKKTMYNETKKICAKLQAE